MAFPNIYSAIFPYPHAPCSVLTSLPVGRGFLCLGSQLLNNHRDLITNIQLIA